MSAALQYLRRERLWPALVVLLATAVILPGIWSYGFWEPQEIQVADAARKRLDRYSLEELNRATAKHFSIPVVHLTGTRKQATVIRARRVAVFLARKHTSNNWNALRRAFSAPSSKVLRDSIEGADSDAELAVDVADIEKLVVADRADRKNSKTKRSRSRKTRRPALTEIAVSKGIALLGVSELGARFPLALLGILAVFVAFLLARRLATPRAGLITALVLVSFPLFLFQSRQLTSDIGVVTGNGLLMLGLVGLAWPRSGARYGVGGHVLDVLLIAVGIELSYASGAALLGLFVPLSAFAIAALSAVPRRDYSDLADPTPRARALSGADRAERLRLLVVGMIAAVAALVTLAWVLSAVFDLKAPVPGDRALFGKALRSTSEYVDALGGVWRVNGDLNVTFDNLFEHIAFGLFPWVALAPIAVAHLAISPTSDRRAFGGYVLFAWAAIAWVVAAVMARKVGPVRYTALIPVAVAIGMWIDNLMAARDHCDCAPSDDDDASATRSFGTTLRLPAVALFVLFAVMVLAKDAQPFADKFASLPVVGAVVTYPKELKLKLALLLFGVLFGVSSALGLWLWRRRTPRSAIVETIPGTYLAGRWGLHAALGVGVVFALFLAQVWTPALSKKLSSKSLFAAYQARRSEGDLLAIMGNHGSGPDYYAGTDYAELRNRKDLITFLEKHATKRQAPDATNRQAPDAKTKRVFALVPSSELCAVHRAARGKFDYAVLDDSHAKFLLISNSLKKGERDKNPLATAIVRAKPTNIERPLNINYDNKIRLIGVNMPGKVARGGTFKMTLFYEVLAPVGGAWKVFVHFDGGGNRFQGDHTPIRKRCATSFWQKGDFIVDTFEVEAGDVTYAKTTYTAMTGFFYGSHGNWKNMPVVEGKHDDNNRASIGRLQLGSKRGGCAASSDTEGAGVLLLLALAALFARRRRRR